MIKYSLIAGVSENWVIGNGPKIPWYIPEDFKLFKEKTTNCVVIMGLKTWNSIPEKYRPLPNRLNIVLSKHNLKLEGAICATSLDEAFNEAEKNNSEIFIIGGASIYNQTIKNASYLYISHIKGEFEGDILFPKFNPEEYQVIEEIPFEKFTFKKYKKK